MNSDARSSGVVCSAGADRLYLRSLAAALIGSVLFLLACGCSRKEDPRISQGELKVTLLEQRLEAIENAHSNLWAIVSKMNAMNGDAISNLMELSAEQSRNFNALEKTFAALREVSASRQPGSTQATRSLMRTTTSATRDGVPIAVYNDIASKAAIKWGSEYDMQEYEINKQVEAYKKLHPAAR